MERITIHCTDSPNFEPVTVEEIDGWHRARGFDKIGYHFVIGVSGETWAGRDLSEVGAHVEGHNTGNIGVCLVGKDKFTPAQFFSLRILLLDLMKAFNIDWRHIYCHYEFDTAIKQHKTCPNIPVWKIMGWVNGDDTLKEYS